MSEIVALWWAHLRLVMMATASASVVALALGIAVRRRPTLERIVVGGASLVQAVPAIALLAMMVPLLAAIGQRIGGKISGIGALPAFVALTLYALLPLVRGVAMGIRGIDRAIHQAALAVGMTERQRLVLVELPLAAPSIVSGLRTATVWTVGMATLGTPVGAASLGNLIFAGLQTRQYDRVLIGCVLAAAMALALDAAFALAERLARGRHATRALVTTFVLVAAAGLAACSTSFSSSRRNENGAAIRIGAKSFTEQLILANVLGCAVRPSPVDVRPSLGTTVAFDALRAGDLDVYVEYTGTAWTTLLHRTDVLDRATMIREVRRLLKAEFGVEVVAELGFENAYALVVRNTEPATDIAALATRNRSASLAIAADYEFFTRPEWASIQRVYAVHPDRSTTMDPSLLYQALASGAVDAIAGYTTDGRIETMGLRALADPRGAIPPYDAIVVVSSRLARLEPEVVERLRGLEGSLDASTMRRLNAAVDHGTAIAEATRTLAVCR